MVVFWLVVCRTHNKWLKQWPCVPRETIESPQGGAVMAAPNDPPPNILSNTDANAGLSNATAHISLINIGDANHILSPAGPQYIETLLNDKTTISRF